MTLFGSSDAEFSQLVARHVEATVNGAGRIVVHATESLDASVPGAGEIVYEGNPADVTQSVTGVGSITAR